MKELVLELYSGTQSLGVPFREAGYDVVSVETNELFTKPPYNLEQWTISVAELTVKKILKRTGGRIPKIIWGSPMCTTYSLAASGAGHRQKINGKIFPKSAKAHLHDSWLLNVLKIINEFLEMDPNIVYFLENPRGGMRNAWFMDEWNERGRYTVTYCQYGDERMKPTDIWTNHLNPSFKPPCKNGASCHVSAPRGSKTGTQGLKGNLERSIIPKELCEHIVNICEVNNV